MASNTKNEQKSLQKCDFFMRLCCFSAAFMFFSDVDWLCISKTIIHMTESGLQEAWWKKKILSLKTEKKNTFFVLKRKFILLRAVVHWAQSTGHASTHTLNTLHTFPTLIRRKAVLQLMSSCKPNSSNVSNALWIMSRTLHSMWCSTSLPASAHSHTQSVSQRSFYRHISTLSQNILPQCISGLFPQILTIFFFNL